VGACSGSFSLHVGNWKRGGDDAFSHERRRQLLPLQTDGKRAGRQDSQTFSPWGLLQALETTSKGKNKKLQKKKKRTVGGSSFGTVVNVIISISISQKGVCTIVIERSTGTDLLRFRDILLTGGEGEIQKKMSVDHYYKNARLTSFNIWMGGHQK